MTQLMRVKLLWTGFSGGPGVTNLFFGTQGSSDGAWITPEQMTQVTTQVDAFCNAVNSRLPASVSLQVDKTTEVIQTATGQIFDYKTLTPFARANGSGTGAYSAASGAVVNWYTSGVRNGRRVRGRTFLVPLAGSALDTNGTLADAASGGLQTAATALLAPTAAGAVLHVWSRPTTPGGSDGIAYPVISARVPDKVAILTSRRD